MDARGDPTQVDTVLTVFDTVVVALAAAEATALFPFVPLEVDIL